MKNIVCIDNKDSEKYLSIGKIYNVVNEYNDLYYLVNDNGDGGWHYKEDFKTKSEIRNEAINKLLDDES